MHRLATVHARDNQRRHDTAYLNKRLFYYRKVRCLKIKYGEMKVFLENILVDTSSAESKRTIANHLKDQQIAL